MAFNDLMFILGLIKIRPLVQYVLEEWDRYPDGRTHTHTHIYVFLHF
jgi:hypothetical protein